MKAPAPRAGGPAHDVIGFTEYSAEAVASTSLCHYQLRYVLQAVDDFHQLAVSRPVSFAPAHEQRRDIVCGTHDDRNQVYTPSFRNQPV
jgi:hypothetical protein